MKYSKNHIFYCAVLCILLVGIFIHCLLKNTDIELFSSLNQFENNLTLNNILNYTNGSEDMRSQLNEIYQKLTEYKHNSEITTYPIKVTANKGDSFNVFTSCDNEILVTYPVGKPGPTGSVGSVGPVGPVGPMGTTGPTGSVGQMITLST